ncbi:peroxiredoxin [Kordiimonas marina]|uniref:peroxiredoxin n=1 Tax=Kordiimonas marina TaxID=2872312 RepID=UPI001FF6CCEF|nr:peroxiredoxin [Kordiimonas marina]MCJ9427630.1 peroxiredoxin [Kordiimonas marina]
MTIKVGDKIPSAMLTTMTADGPAPVSTDEFFAGKTVAFFAVPGAYTPTCSAKHLPGFVTHAGDLKAKGADVIACMSVNDVFVMNAWGKDQGADDKVVMLADGNADFTKALGMELDASGFGMGTRAKRFSMIVKDGVVTELNIEDPGAFHVSSADHMLTQL